MPLSFARQRLWFIDRMQGDICVGSPVANRTQHQTEGLIGFFVNTLVLRTHMQQEGFGDLLRRVRQTCIEAYVHFEPQRIERIGAQFCVLPEGIVSAPCWR